MNMQFIWERFNEELSQLMLEERKDSSVCRHQWEKRMLSCQLVGYYCSRCGKETLP